MSAEVKESARPAQSAPSGWGLRRGDDIDPTLVVIESLGGGSRYEVLAAHQSRYRAVAPAPVACYNSLHVVSR